MQHLACVGREQRPETWVRSSLKEMLSDIELTVSPDFKSTEKGRWLPCGNDRKQTLKVEQGDEAPVQVRGYCGQL